jgi:cytochrome c biogenesis protein ResB
MAPQNIKLDDHTVSIRQRMPKKYNTSAQLFTKQGVNKNVNISVNEPLKVNGWNVYQSSYNQAMGRWSETSTLTIVKDPWLWLVYVGIFMLIAGALGLFINGKSYKVRTKAE